MVQSTMLCKLLELGLCFSLDKKSCSGSCRQSLGLLYHLWWDFRRRQLLLDLAHPPFSINNQEATFESSVNNRTAKNPFKMLTKNVSFMLGDAHLTRGTGTKTTQKHERRWIISLPPQSVIIFQAVQHSRSVLFKVNCF